MSEYSLTGSVYYEPFQQHQAQNTDFYNGQYFIPSQISGISSLFCFVSRCDKYLIIKATDGLQHVVFASALPTADFENELPLLDELGINFAHIRQKTFAVLNPVGSVSPDVGTLFSYIISIFS